MPALLLVLVPTLIFAGAPAQLTARTQSLQTELERARHMMEAGSIEEAAALLRALVKAEPANADAHLLLGSALALVPEPAQAVEELRRVIQLRPSFAPGYHIFGTALARFAQLDAAKGMFEKAIELDPSLAEARVSLALLLAQRGEAASARLQLARAIELYAGSASAAYPHYLRARILIEENEMEAALRELDKAIRLRPDYAEAYLSRGQVKKKLQQPDEALQAFQKAVELAPSNSAARYQLGAAYLRAGQAEQALHHLRRAAELKPADRSVLFQLCQALHRTGRAEEARECQRRLEARVEADFSAAQKAGRLNDEGLELESQGDLQGALEKYRAAVQAGPFQTVFRRNLALVLCRMGRWEEGIVELKKVLELDPEDTEATKALYIALDKIREVRK